MTIPKDEELDEILESLAPNAFKSYNRGLLPDEDGYSAAAEYFYQEHEDFIANAKKLLKAREDRIAQDARIDTLNKLRARHLLSGDSYDTLITKMEYILTQQKNKGEQA